MKYALGRLPHNPARVAAQLAHRCGASGPVPADLPRADIVWTPTLAQNNTLPTCPVAGLANSLRMWALIHGFDLAADEQCLFDLYAAVAGCAPTPLAIGGTQGLMLLDVLEHVRANGFRFATDQPPAEMEFAAVNPTDLRAVRDAIYANGSAYCGGMLHEQDVTEPLRWAGLPTTPVDGGHCYVPWRYSPIGFGDATWGQTVDDDLSWWQSRIEEVYSIRWLFAVAP